MIGGYMGTLLYVNLSEKTIQEKPLDPDLAKSYLGGSGLGAKLLYDMTDEKTDPLGKDNPLMFLNGPFTGTKIPTSGRHAVVSKSPLTGIWGECDVGGAWGFELKSAGYDGIIMTGISDKPVYLWINDNKAEIRPAEHLWGIDTYDLESLIREETDPKAVVSAIGVAGEKLGLMASIMNDGSEARVAGRCGLGAVMGSKKLKAVVVRGTGKTQVADPERLKALIKEQATFIAKNAKGFGQYGTSGGIEGHEEMLNFPFKNWAQERWQEGAKKINGIRMYETILKKKYFCKTCVIGCGRVIEITEGKYNGVKGAGPEYETFGTLGGLLLIDDLNGIAKANEMCNRYGIDTISLGGTVAFAYEAYEKGILPKEWCDGLELRWGDVDLLIELIKRIAYKEGKLGALLSQGIKRVSEVLDQDTIEFAAHVKGLEFPAHDPRAYNGVALSYATSNRGACHVQGFTHGFEKAFTMPEIGIYEPHNRHLIEGKGEFVAKLQDLMCLFDSIKMCKFAIIGGFKLTDFTKLYNAVTGFSLSPEALMKIGQRIYNLKRLYNLKCGITVKDDILPKRFYTLKRGPNLPDIPRMRSDYYTFRDWDENGVPKKKLLDRLGLSKEAKFLY